MADTCTAVITAAYQEAEILDDTETPQPEQATRGLRVLQDIYNSLANGGAFGALRVRLVTGDYTSVENARVAYSGVGSVTITLPTTVTNVNGTDPYPYDVESQLSISGETNVDNNNRAPIDLSATEIVGEDQERYVYDALLGDYVRITNLELTDDAPLCNRWRGEIVAMLTHALARKEDKPAFERAATMAKYRLLTNPTAPRKAIAVDSF